MTSKEFIEYLKGYLEQDKDKPLDFPIMKDGFKRLEKDLETLFELGKRLFEIYEEIPEKLKFMKNKIKTAKKDTATAAYNQGEYDTLDIVNRVYIDDLVTIISKLWSNEEC